MLALWVREDLGAMTMKGYSTFPKALIGASPSDGFVSYPGHLLGESYTSAEMQSVYSTAPVDWANVYMCERETTNMIRVCLYKYALG